VRTLPRSLFLADGTKGNAMHTLVSVLNAIPWFAWIPIVAIICGTIGGVVKSVHSHNERMAMIRMGMHPDAKQEKPYYSEQEV
jgi:hypothetical protein